MLTKKSITSTLSTFLCTFFFSCILVSSSSYKYAFIPLALIAMVALYKTMPALKNSNIVMISTAMVAYFLISALSLFIYGGDISQLDMPSRSILGVVILLYVTQYPPKTKWLFWGVAIGTNLAGLVAIYHYFLLGGRALNGVGHMIIQAGGIACSLSLLSIVAFFYAKSINDQALTISAAIGVILGLTTTLLSGVRGAWVPLPFILIALLWVHRKQFSNRSRWVALFSTLICLTFAYPNVKVRIDSFASDLQKYKAENSNSSSGARIEMWKSALYSAKENPIFGQGFDGVKIAKERQIKQGIVAPIALKYNRAHNQFFEELQTKGGIGLAVILSFFGVPLFLFLKKIRTLNMYNDRYYLALAGAVHVTAVIGFSLTQHYLAHHSGIIFFTVGVAIFAGAVFSSNNNSRVHSS
ncbi:O-antigen ligase family protein [Vibrio renipiscarius]|uniref:RfaL protein n=1 Tax=Vibrio renipiscarius TaxID=1461322 RepID=A0A0C2P437_9VIBR|nr:O-antigen ligase [Vibrio renipiscarius]KII81197.1 RfaL protein [Vibrio renipiscarius]KII81614.1 RfaL protein [Vibrio renipiscarius]